ncbi:AAA family ATPase [Bacteriovoracaceae bacterium]|nr:AAA family ATPase [Bacteriovoracaceae bacterium]
MVARQEGIDITLLPLSLSSRGQGRVGEMTRLVSGAFDLAINEAEKFRTKKDSFSGGIILLVDEADALTQSRESSQMHHEDRAGVNAFIRGVSRIERSGLPIGIIMCTNRLESIDPAVQRRASEVLVFKRPNRDARKAIIYPVLSNLGLSDKEIDNIVEVTGETNDLDYGFACSDLIQRLIPTIILDAYPDKRILAERALSIAKEMLPTPPFSKGV